MNDRLMLLQERLDRQEAILMALFSGEIDLTRAYALFVLVQSEYIIEPLPPPKEPVQDE